MQVYPIKVPQINPNDDFVEISQWLVPHGATVNPGDPICIIETSKATEELTALEAGILFQIASEGKSVRVDERIGLIGSSLQEAEEYNSSENTDEARQVGEATKHSSPTATPRARALADEHGIALERVLAVGIRGTIKESDVKRYLSEQLHDSGEGWHFAKQDRSLPPSILPWVICEGGLSRHDRLVKRNLQQSLQEVLLATLDTEVDLDDITERIQLMQRRGTMLSLLHVVLCALGRVLPRFPQVMSFIHDQRVYRYRQSDVAFVVRSVDGRLYTPVVRQVDALDPKEIARYCHRAISRINHGRVTLSELEGACFTVSHISQKSVTRFMALPNLFQSTALAIAGERNKLVLDDGKAIEAKVATLTLSYDHALYDGVYATEFLDSLTEEMKVILDDSS